MLYSRTDCCTEFINNFKITVGSNIDGVGNAVCVADGGDVTQKRQIPNNCDPPLQGRYIHVKLNGTNRAIVLCEIEVHGSRGLKLLVIFLPYL